MVSSTYVGYVQTLLNYQWGYFFTLETSYTSTAGASVGPPWAVFVAWAGAGLAFILSLMGALDNAGKTLYYVEDSLDDFIKRYSGGKYVDILDIVEDSDLMQSFLNTFTWDLIMYTNASFLHSIFLLAGGTLAAVWILLKVQTLTTDATYTNDWSTIPYRFGWNYALFGMLVGSINYLAGNVAKNIVDEVLLSIGLRDHAYADDTKNSVTTELVVSPTGVSSYQTSATYKSTVVDYNYAKLLKMQDSWGAFFGLQRFVQLVAPYMLLACVEAGVVSAFALLFSFTNIE